MKVSICIPQYNRVDFLLKNLAIIAKQTYQNIEVVVSDDCSTDSTSKELTALKNKYRFPLVYHRNLRNKGYDCNMRQSMELASGDYVFILGNDDSLNDITDIAYLVDFLKQNNYPDLGYCNYAEEIEPEKVFERAVSTGVLGSGSELALKVASNFSFVAGLIYKRDKFLQFNTDRYDGSIYAQIYLSSLMIASGCNVFSITKPLVIKDIQVGETHRNSYRDKIARNWKDLRVVDGGLPSVMNVLLSAFRDAGVLTQDIRYRIFFRMYSTTYPHWLLDYRSNDALPEAVGMINGLYPSRNKNFKELNLFNRQRIYFLYFLTSMAGLLVPVYFFIKLKPALYKWLRKK